MPGERLVADDEVAGSRANLRVPSGLRERRKARAATRARPARPARAARRDRASRIGWRIASAGGVGLGDRAVEQRDRVVALEVRRVGQHEIGEGDGLRLERVARRRRTESCSRRRASFARQHLARAGRVHRRVPRHVRHEQQQRVDRIGIAGDGVGDHHVHQAVRGERRFPRVRLVDAQRRAVGVDARDPRAASGMPSGMRSSGVSGAMRSADRSRAAVRRDRRGYGARARKLPGPSSAPSSIWIRCSARQVWKPFECAEMPRIAYIATGRPTTLSCVRPHMSVHADRQLDRLLERDVRHFAREPA